MEEETIDLPADNIEDKKEKIRKLVGEGYTNREIADRTGIPFGTVGYHAARFRKKSFGQCMKHRKVLPPPNGAGGKDGRRNDRSSGGQYRR